MSAVVAGQGRPWWQPTFSHQHGPLVALLAAFQAEHPLVQQIRRRRSLQPRLLLWAGVYGAIAVALGALLAWRTPALIPLGALALLVLAIDGLAVLQRRQRGLSHELIAFAAVCLAGPFAWTVASGRLEPAALGLWGLCSLTFGSSVVLLKVRRDPAAGLTPVLVMAALATALVSGGWWLGLLRPLEALAYGVALLKGAWLLARLESYRSASIGRVAAIESATALLFLGTAALGVLPLTLESSGEAEPPPRHTIRGPQQQPGGAIATAVAPGHPQAAGLGRPAGVACGRLLAGRHGGGIVGGAPWPSIRTATRSEGRQGRAGAFHRARHDPPGAGAIHQGRRDGWFLMPHF